MLVLDLVFKQRWIQREKPIKGSLFWTFTNWLVLQMRLTWVSGDEKPQQVQYGDGMSQNSVVTTFNQDDMCSGEFPFP